MVDANIERGCRKPCLGFASGNMPRSVPRNGRIIDRQLLTPELPKRRGLPPIDAAWYTLPGA